MAQSAFVNGLFEHEPEQETTSVKQSFGHGIKNLHNLMLWSEVAMTTVCPTISHSRQLTCHSNGDPGGRSPKRHPPTDLIAAWASPLALCANSHPCLHGWAAPSLGFPKTHSHPTNPGCPKSSRTATVPVVLTAASAAAAVVSALVLAWPAPAELLLLQFLRVQQQVSFQLKIWGVCRLEVPTGVAQSLHYRERLRHPHPSLLQGHWCPQPQCLPNETWWG
mmetsp:Transcript_16560/g.28969  ORF Transcript_16560/g.28969 Transcript_16560/m.28969 type:complete len:221 (+) Transcript_16560:35-697(+)